MSRSIVETIEDPLTGNVTLFLDDGYAITLARHERDLCALSWWLDSMEITQDNGRIDVIQHGRKVGELPAYWHPGLAQSTSFLFDYRPGDLVKQDGKWIASRSLGAGDLDCLIGFVRKECE